MSSLPWLSLEHIAPFLSLEYQEHLVPEGAEIVNYAECRLCKGIYLPDSAMTGICGRELCKAIQILWAKMDHAEREQARTAVA
jgi:hypothetical protein